MKKRKILFPNEAKHIFTEGVDYATTGEKSIWGVGDEKTLEILQKTKFSGKWLNLAAGDGRYNNFLLDSASEVIASDIDKGALKKLVKNTPTNLKRKLKTKTFDIVKPFPFENSIFNGVFSTGTLHLFPESILAKIFKEIDRILTPNGEIFLDFATDIKRVLPDGSLKTKANETSYTLGEAKKLFKKSFPKYNLKIIESKVPQEIVNTGKITYTFSCCFILVTCTKSPQKS